MNFIPESRKFHYDFEDYFRSSCLKPTNPFNNKIVYKYKHSVEEILEIFFEILNLDIPEERLGNFGIEFKSAFKSYYESERKDMGSIVNNLDTINIKYEVFLKIIAFLKYRNSNSWKESFPNLIIKVFNLSNDFNIKKRKQEFWVNKNPVEAMNRFSFLNRQISTHEARKKSLAQCEEIFQNVITLCLIGVDINFDVLKQNIPKIKEIISFYEVVDKRILFKSPEELEAPFGYLGSAKFSSTGSLLALGGNNFTLGSAGIVIYDFDNLKHFTSLYGYVLTFSPDDKEIICCQHSYVEQGTRELIVRFNIEERFEAVDLKEDKEYIILDTENKGILPQDLDWSPCGKYLAISSGEYGFYIMNLRDKTIIRACNLDVVESKWSPEGDRLAVTVNEATYKYPDLYQIYILSFPTYKYYKISRSKNSESSPSWSSDGQFIVFTRESKNLRYSHIYVTKADGKGELRQLTSGKNYDFSPSWSPTGSSIAHLRIDDKYLDLDNEKMEKVSVNLISLKKIL